MDVLLAINLTGWFVWAILLVMAYSRRNWDRSFEADGSRFWMWSPRNRRMFVDSRGYVYYVTAWAAFAVGGLSGVVYWLPNWFS